MEIGLLAVYVVVGAVLFLRHTAVYVVHMRVDAVPIGEYIPPGSRWRIWYSLIVSAALWPIALLLGNGIGGGARGAYFNAVRFTALGMLLGGGWGM